MVPATLLALFILVVHMQVLHAAPIDPRRRRLRSAANLTMMAVVGLMAYGFGVVRAGQVRAFVFVWTLVPALLFMVIVLALLDVAHSLRLHRRAAVQLRAHLAAQSVGAAQTLREHRTGGEGKEGAGKDRPRDGGR